jgi:hypothetical protein
MVNSTRVGWRWAAFATGRGCGGQRADTRRGWRLVAAMHHALVCRMRALMG